eukprot:scaffold29544_cov50-Phaeocystis_antarctica.AAC.1
MVASAESLSVAVAAAACRESAPQAGGRPAERLRCTRQGATVGLGFAPTAWLSLALTCHGRARSSSGRSLCAAGGEG